MIFVNTNLPGAYIIELEKIEDFRGFFARTWCKKEFEAKGLTKHLAQANTAYSVKKGTLRGMHFQIAPFQETKLIRCISGAIFDVIIDLRPDSPTHMGWFGIELSADNRRMLYQPEGFAHGYQTLADNTETLYQVSQFYSPEHERGVRWNDPAFGIEWPESEGLLISEKDRTWPDYSH